MVDTVVESNAIAHRDPEPSGPRWQGGHRSRTYKPRTLQDYKTRDWAAGFGGCAEESCTAP